MAGWISTLHVNKNFHPQKIKWCYQSSSLSRRITIIHVPHVLGPMHFISWIDAKYKPGTHQELCYLNFELTKWVQEKNCQSCYEGAIWSVEVAKWPQHNPLRLLFQWRGWKSTLSPSFITFSEREPFLRGFLRWAIWAFWSQRCIGVSKTCGRSAGSLRRKLAIREETLCGLLFQICFFRPKHFQILPLDGGPQCLNHVILSLFQHG